VNQADGFTCESDDRCADDHGCEYGCNMVPGDTGSQATCYCPRGYKLDTTPNEKNCVNIDECQEGRHDCQAENKVIVSRLLTNTNINNYN
jgi:hypothetical protein